MKSTFRTPHQRQGAGLLHLLGVCCLISTLVGCVSPLRPQDQQARDALESLQPDVRVTVTGDNFSKVTASGLTNINRARFVDGLATGCVEAGGELRGMAKTDGWVCFLPDTNREAFAVIYTPTEMHFLRPFGADAGFVRELEAYGYARRPMPDSSHR